MPAKNYLYDGLPPQLSLRLEQRYAFFAIAGKVFNSQARVYSMEKWYEYDNDGYALIYESQSGGKVFKNRDAKKDSARQLYVASILADMGYEVKILPFIIKPKNPDKNLDYKNPDFKINGRITELKGAVPNKAVTWAEITNKTLDNAVDQFKMPTPHGQAEVLIIDLENRKGTLHKVPKKLWDALHKPESKKGILEVWFFADTPKGPVLAKITREQVQNNNFSSLESLREVQI